MIFLTKQENKKDRRAGTMRTSAGRYYRADTAGGQSPFAKLPAKKRKRKYFFGAVDLILLAGLLIVAAYSLVLSPNPVVDANDYVYHSQSVYAAAAKVPLGQLKNRNKLTFDETALARAMQSKFPEITNIRVELPVFSNRPVLRLIVSKPSFILDSTGSSFIVDSAGVAVTPVDRLKITNLPTIDDKSGFSVKTGSQALSSGSVDFINALLAQCQKSNIPIASLTLPSAPEELQLRTKDQGYYVKFYLGGNVLQEAGQFLAARHHFLQIHQAPGQYLDVRVPGKIYYK